MPVEVALLPRLRIYPKRGDGSTYAVHPAHARRWRGTVGAVFGDDSSVSDALGIDFDTAYDTSDAHAGMCGDRVCVSRIDDNGPAYAAGVRLGWILHSVRVGDTWQV